MQELHALVDFENVQPSLEELARLAPGVTDIWLFHGPHQARPARQLAANNTRVTLVPHTGKGKNALDFHLSFYLGYVAARHPDAQLVVVANDKGYDSMIGHARALGFTARRVGIKATKARTTRAATPAKGAPVARKPAPRKTLASAKPASPARKPALKASTAAPARKAAATQAPAPTKKSPTRKMPRQQAAAPQTRAQPTAGRKTPVAQTVAARTPAKKRVTRTPAPASASKATRTRAQVKAGAPATPNGNRKRPTRRTAER